MIFDKSRRTPAIWIDLDNAPHVPFFIPILKCLEDDGFSIFITLRDNGQTLSLARNNGLEFTCVGRHHGGKMVAKGLGLFIRALLLLPHVLRVRPTLAVSHGSRSQMFLARILRIPSLMLVDYEHARMVPMAGPDFLAVPEVVYKSGNYQKARRVFFYEGIKEDVYVPSFKPDLSLRGDLGIPDDHILVTMRPPATDAHYHDPGSEGTFETIIEWLGTRDDVKMVLLPRRLAQEMELRRRWVGLLDSGKMIIPEGALDGLNLIWNSDLVVSGGGTMNREAAALNVPVYSIFTGPKGEVDKFLEQEGRMVFIKSRESAQEKIRLEKRDIGEKYLVEKKPSKKQVVAIIKDLVGPTGET